MGYVMKKKCFLTKASSPFCFWVYHLLKNRTSHNTDKPWPASLRSLNHPLHNVMSDGLKGKESNHINPFCFFFFLANSSNPHYMSRIGRTPVFLSYAAAEALLNLLSSHWLAFVVLILPIYRNFLLLLEFRRRLKFGSLSLSFFKF